MILLSEKSKKIYIPSFILVTAFLLSLTLIYLSPTNGVMLKDKVYQNVTTTKAMPSDYPFIYNTGARVIPFQKITLKSRVNGNIVKSSPNFIPGHLLNKGDFIIQIDDRELKIDLTKKQALLKQAQANYDIEVGKQNIAKSSMEKLAKVDANININSRLALRQPQLEHARAEVDKAAANVAEAELKLSYSTIRSPFNSFILQRYVDLGGHIGIAGNITTLVNSDTFWLEALIPNSLAYWFANPLQPLLATVKVDGSDFKAKIIKVISALDDKTMMTKVLIEINSPFKLVNPKDTASDVKVKQLLLGDYVPVTLYGNNMNNVFKIKKDNIHNSSVWIYDNKKLAIKKVKIIYDDENYAYISDGVTPNDLIIDSSLVAPFEGMDLKVLE